MAHYGARVSTRMEKIEGTSTALAVASFATLELPFQLEGGDEECQVKRLILSAGGSTNFQYELYLGDEAMTGSQPIQRLVAVFVGNGSAMVDRTTTMRVPRDWHLLARITNLGSGAADLAAQTVLHYKVLS